MRVCDICKKDNVTREVSATIDENGNAKYIELCESCYRELKKREAQHRHAAYVETVKAMTGEIPRKAHWWDW